MPIAWSILGWCSRVIHKVWIMYDSSTRMCATAMIMRSPLYADCSGCICVYMLSWPSTTLYSLLCRFLRNYRFRSSAGAEPVASLGPSVSRRPSGCHSVQSKVWYLVHYMKVVGYWISCKLVVLFTFHLTANVLTLQMRRRVPPVVAIL